MRTAADDVQRHAGASTGANGAFDLLVRQQPRNDDEVIAAAGAHREPVDVDRTREHVGAAAVVTLHALRDVARIRDVRRRPLRRAAVPRGERAHHRPCEGAAGEAADVALFVEHEAAHGVDVAHVDRAGRHDHALRPGRRGADDRVVAAQVKRLERCRIERRERPKKPLFEGKSLQKRRPHALGWDEVREVWRVDRRVDGRVGKRGQEMREDALRAAALVEVIVDERDAQRLTAACVGARARPCSAASTSIRSVARRPASRRRSPSPRRARGRACRLRSPPRRSARRDR